MFLPALERLERQQSTRHHLTSNPPFIFKESLTAHKLNRTLDMARPEAIEEEGGWSRNNFVTNRLKWKRHRLHVANKDVTLKVLAPVILAIYMACKKQLKYVQRIRESSLHPTKQ